MRPPEPDLLLTGELLQRAKDGDRAPHDIPAVRADIAACVAEELGAVLLPAR